MARLNKTQIYAINWLSQQNKDVESIAHELKIPVEQIIKTIEKNNTVNKQGADIKDKQAPVVNSKSKNLMINTTMGKQNKVVSIMTREASEYNDAVKSKHEPVIPPKTKAGIFIPSEKNKRK
jgi:hypothetical protein